MKEVFLGLLVLAVGGLLTTALLKYDISSQHFDRTVQQFQKDFSFLVPAWKEDQEHRIKIATSYCNLLRSQSKVGIEGFDQCVLTASNYPLEKYTEITGKKVGTSWNKLALSEKALVVEEIQTAETRYNSIVASNKIAEQAQKSQAALEKALSDYQDCTSRALKEGTVWLGQQCPSNGSNFLKNMDCRSDAMGSAEYKSQFGCKYPF